MTCIETTMDQILKKIKALQGGMKLREKENLYPIHFKKLNLLSKLPVFPVKLSSSSQPLADRGPSASVSDLPKCSSVPAHSS